ncbi:MAG TPA: hypothetical protein VMC80_00655 [Patescibacteria group bacterium]|nr:hypothetical protein [Patescibacteria group bacterium]
MGVEKICRNVVISRCKGCEIKGSNLYPNNPECPENDETEIIIADGTETKLYLLKKYK